MSVEDEGRTLMEELRCEDRVVRERRWAEGPVGPQPSLPTSCEFALEEGLACGGEFVCEPVAEEVDGEIRWRRVSCEGGTVVVDRWTESSGACRPELVEGEACTGSWACSPVSVEAPTRTHWFRTRCRNGTVAEEYWLEPRGGPSGICAVVQDEVIGAGGPACTRPSIVVDRGALRVAWTDADGNGQLVRRPLGEGWGPAESSFGFRPERVELSGDRALVQRNGRLELWDVAEAPRGLLTFEHEVDAATGTALATVADQAFALGVRAGGGGYHVHRMSAFEGAFDGVDLASDPRDVRALEIRLNERGWLSVLFTHGADLVFDGPFGRDVLDVSEVRGPYGELLPAAPTMLEAGEVAYVAVSEAGAFVDGFNEVSHLVMRRDEAGWSRVEVARDMLAACPAFPSEGTRCALDRLTHGRLALAEGQGEPMAVGLQHRETGTLTWTCVDGPLGGERHCFWQGRPEVSSALSVGALGEARQRLLELPSDTTFTVAREGRGLHFAMVQPDGAGCAVRHVELLCE